MNPSNIHCASCGEILTGPFCSQCGEQRLSERDRSFVRVLSDFFQSLSNLDGKLVKSFHHLCLKPGLYDYHYHIGARNQYFKPIALFLLVNVLFVTLMPLNDFYVPFEDQRNHPYAFLFNDWLNHKIAASGLTEQAYAEKYDQLVRVLARSILILGVPFLLPFVALLFRDRRYYLSDHFVFSLNLYSWWLLWMLATWWVAKLIVAILSLTGFEQSVYPLFGNALSIGLVVYCYLAIGRMYLNSRWQRVWKIPLLLGALVVSHLFYRMAQLVITTWSI